MKHILTIHSPITFLAAVGTIVYENIATEDVIVVCANRYNPKFSSHFNGKTVPSYDTIESEKSIFSKIISWDYTKSVNGYISQLIGNEEFIAYVDLMSVFNRYLVMHSKCIQFHIIEEGIVNYADYDDFMLWTADLRSFQWQWSGLRPFKEVVNGCLRMLRGRSLRLLAMPIHPNLYTLHRGVNAYCFSDSAFQYTAKAQKKLLDWTSIEKYVANDSSSYPDGSWFWIGDGLCGAYKIPMHIFEEALKQFLEEINPSKKSIDLYLKFRGTESEEEKNITLSNLSFYNFNVVLIPSAVIMELVFLKLKNLTVCGITSSLLIYAHLMGHATYSLFSYLPDEYGISLVKNYATISKKVGYSS